MEVRMRQCDPNIQHPGFKSRTNPNRLRTRHRLDFNFFLNLLPPGGEKWPIQMIRVFKRGETQIWVFMEEVPGFWMFPSSGGEEEKPAASSSSWWADFSRCRLSALSQTRTGNTGSHGAFLLLTGWAADKMLLLLVLLLSCSPGFRLQEDSDPDWGDFDLDLVRGAAAAQCAAPCWTSHSERVCVCRSRAESRGRWKPFCSR